MSKGFHDPRYRAVIDKLIAARKQLGLTQQEAAVRLNRVQRFVSRYETGERRLDFVELRDIATALMLNPTTLMAGIPAPPTDA